MKGRAPTTRVFVYGSLMRGRSNAHELRAGRCLGERCTAVGFVLHALGQYPGLARSPRGVVFGELWEIGLGMLRHLDHFEEHPHGYKRERITLADGTEAFAYLPPRARTRGKPVITGGRWHEDPAQGRSSKRSRGDSPTTR